MMFSFFLSYRKLCFHTIKNASRGCALGARVGSCRGNRASARECAKAHSFLYRKLCIYTIKNALLGSHMRRSGMMSLMLPAAGAGFYRLLEGNQKGEAAWRKKTLSKNGIRKTVCKTVQLRCPMRQAAFFLRMQPGRNESLVFGRF